MYHYINVNSVLEQTCDFFHLFLHIDAVKAEVPELDNLGFMENVTSSLTSLLSSPSKEIKCVESIVFSSFNPPPSYRRLYLSPNSFHTFMTLFS